jgi:hypothetical protein
VGAVHCIKGGPRSTAHARHLGIAYLLIDQPRRAAALDAEALRDETTALERAKLSWSLAKTAKARGDATWMVLAKEAFEEAPAAYLKKSVEHRLLCASPPPDEPLPKGCNKWPEIWVSGLVSASKRGPVALTTGQNPSR